MSEMPLSEEERKAGEKAILIQAQHMEPLVRSEGYLMLRKIGEQQILNHYNAWSVQASTRDEDMFRKGTINGIRIILNTPDQILDHRKAILESMLKPDAIATPEKPIVDLGDQVAEPSAIVESPEDTEGTYQAVEETRPHGE